MTMSFAKWLLVCLISFFATSSWGQNDEKTAAGASPVIYHEVSGSPFFNPDWSNGVIYFTSGRVANQFKLKFDCLKNQLLLEFKGNSFYAQSKVSAFTLIPPKSRTGDSLLFKNGYPPAANVSEETFLWVLEQGTATLLCRPAKTIMEEPQLVSKVVYRRIIDSYEYYLLVDGQLNLLPADREALLALFPRHQQEMQQYMTNQKFNPRNATELVQVARYYNMLEKK